MAQVKVFECVGDNLRPTESINREYSSFFIKGMVEAATGKQVSYEDFIKIMTDECGFEAAFSEDGVNCYFNVSEESITQLRRKVSTQNK